MTTQSDNWSDYWVNEGAGGEVFVNQHGEKHVALADFWHQQLVKVAGNSRLIDIASGAGSIFATLSFDDTVELHAADISQAALQQLTSRLPKVKTHVCSAVQIPLESNYFDFAVSQFGLEYAGANAFLEAARLLKKGGALVLLCHIEDGFIDAKNKAELNGAKLVKQVGFVDQAIQVTEAAFAGQKQAFVQAIDAFTAVEPDVANYVNRYPSGVHAHLYQGFKQLFNQRQHYQVEDITQWLSQMTVEVDKTIMRLSEMRKAASSDLQMQSISDKLRLAGMRDVTYQRFFVPEQKMAIAWQLTATKGTS